MVGLGFNPWVGHLGIWDVSRGGYRETVQSAKLKDYPGTPLPISQRWLECVHDELSALAVKSLSLSILEKISVAPSLSLSPCLLRGLLCLTPGTRSRIAPLVHLHITVCGSGLVDRKTKKNKSPHYPRKVHSWKLRGSEERAREDLPLEKEAQN